MNNNHASTIKAFLHCKPSAQTPPPAIQAGWGQPVAILPPGMPGLVHLMGSARFHLPCNQGQARILNSPRNDCFHEKGEHRSRATAVQRRLLQCRGLALGSSGAPHSPPRQTSQRKRQGLVSAKGASRVAALPGHSLRVLSALSECSSRVRHRGPGPDWTQRVSACPDMSGLYMLHTKGKRDTETIPSVPLHLLRMC